MDEDEEAAVAAMTLRAAVETAGLERPNFPREQLYLPATRQLQIIRKHPLHLTRRLLRQVSSPFQHLLCQ